MSRRKHTLNKLTLFILFFLFLGSNNSFFAQNYLANVEFFTPEDGLAGRYGNCTFKDHRGIIWIGTQFGLNRFDGRDFLTFNEASGLHFNQVMEIHVDSEGWLWLFRTCYGKQNCTRNLQFFHSITHEILSFRERFENQVNFLSEDIVSILSSENKDVFLSASNQVIHWSKGKIIRKIDLSELESAPTLLSMVGNDKLAGWFHVDDSLGHAYLQYLVFDFEGNIIYQQSIPNNTGKKPLNALSLNGIDFWGRKLARHNYHFNPRKPQFVIREDGKLIRDTTTWVNFGGLHYLHHNPFRLEGWTCVGKGPVVHSPNKGVVYRFDDFPEIQKQLFKRHIFFDENDVTWIAGRYGVLRAQLRLNPFQRILHNARSDLESPNKRICQDVISVGEGRLLLLAQTKIFEKKAGTEILPANIGKWNNIPVTLTKGFKDNFWGMKSNVLFEIKTGTQYEMDTAYVKEQIDFQNVLTQYYSSNRLWFGTDKGLHYFDFSNEQFYELKNYNQFDELKTQIVHHIFEETKDRIWLCTSGGLYLFSPKKACPDCSTGILEKYWEGGTDNFQIPATSFYLMQSARKGGFWLATQQGLIYWNPTENTTRRYTVENGLPSNEILAVHEDEYGFLWLPTNAGLVQFHIESERTKLWIEADGISSNDFEPYSYHCEKDSEDSGRGGMVWFGTTNGYTVFHPKDFKDIDLDERPDIPLNILRFEQFSAETKKLENRTQRILKDSEIVLQPGEQLFNLRVALADYVTGKDAQYGYRITGVQDFWQEGKENLIRISGLPYGNFTLEIRGRLANGQYSSNEIHLPIQVLKPFYLKNWFFITVGMSLFLGFFFWYKWRTGQLKKRQKILEKTVKERTKTIEERTKTIEKQAEQLRQLDQLKSRFFANVSHELRTPLTLMLGPTGSLMKRGYLNEKDRQLLQYIYNNEKHLLNLVNEILDLSKLETNRIQIKETAVNFHDFLQPLVAQFRSFGDSVSVNFEFEYRLDKNLNLLLDTDKFEKIVNNFLSNALKFTPKDGTVTLLAEGKNDRILISVKDTGSGIHSDDLPHIFERFYQSKQPNAPVQGGTGIGLSLCKELSELLDGKVWAESEWRVGSVFYFEFPKRLSVVGYPLSVGESLHSPPDPPKGELPPTVENTKAPVTEVAGGSSPLGAGGARGQRTTDNRQQTTVLIVEDNPELLAYLKSILEDRYEVLTAENGKVALDHLLQTADSEFSGQACQLIISDLMMPVMDGFQLLETIKSKDRWRHIPVIMMTARADIKVKLRALRIGVDDYITKPFEEEELLVRIENLLRNYQVRQSFTQTKTNTVKPLLSNGDLGYLLELENLVKANVGDYDLNAEFLSFKLAQSRSAFFKKVKKLTGLTPNEYINEVRYNYARELLENRSVTSVKQAAHSIGMKHVKYFSKQFKDRFGKSPSSFF